MKHGADKVSINTAAINNKKLIFEASSEFGSQCIVASVDIIKENNMYYVYSNGKILRNINYVEWIKELEDLGAGELLINDVSNDGLIAVTLNLHL